MRRDKGYEQPKEASPPSQVIEFKESPLVGHMITIVCIALACFFLWMFIQWLFSRPPGAHEDKSLWALCRRCLRQWTERIHALVRRLMQGNRNRHRGPNLFFSRLVHWGARSGLPRAYSETPKEYGRRLVRFFPTFRSEIERIVEQFNRFNYGHMDLNDIQLFSLRMGWKRLRSPKLWPRRLKLLLFHTEEPSICQIPTQRRPHR